MRKSFIAIAAIAAALSLASQAAAFPNLVCTGAFSGATYHNVVVPTKATCTLSDTRVTGSVTVQAGGSFFVDQESTGKTTIAGSVTANQCGAVILESSGTTPGQIVIGGNLTITNCTSTVEGQFDGGQGDAYSTSSPFPAAVPPTLVIGGSVKCDNNNIELGCQFDDAFIGGTFECSGNSGGCGLQAATISGNANLTGNGITEIENGSVGGSLDCANNSDCDVGLNAIGKGVTLTGNGPGGSDVGDNVIGGSLNCVGNTGGVGESTPNTIAGIAAGQCLGF